ncbi:MAG: DUF423 domain-containing protein [bacterium]
MGETLQSLDALSIGAFLGMIGVILGAMGSHALADTLTPDQLNTFETGVRYQMFHSLLLVALGLAGRDHPVGLAVLFGLGILLFSGSIYALVLVDWTNLGTLKTIVAISTPIGGSLLIFAWGWLTWWGLTLS